MCRVPGRKQKIKKRLTDEEKRSQCTHFLSGLILQHYKNLLLLKNI